MFSASRVWSAVGSKGAVFCVALCVSCSAESPSSDAPNAGAPGAIAGWMGAFGGAGGQVGGTGGSAGVAVAPVGGVGGASGGAGGAGVGGQAGLGGGGGIGGGIGGSGGAGGLGGAGGAAGGSAEAGCEVSPITDEMRDRYDNMNNAYYTKFASANEIVVATGDGVVDEALTRYCRLLREMYSNEDVRQATIADDMWFTMIAEDEQLSSLPQIDSTYGTSLDRRARGLGGLTPTICAEDSIMCSPDDLWDGDCICAHETGHTLYSSGIARVPALSSRLTSITNAVRQSGRLANAYVWMDGNESGMMSWGVQAWYDCAINGTNGAYHSDINTRAELQSELPEFYEFLSELLPSDNQYQDCYANP